jgi:hypothetical protein
MRMSKEEECATNEEIGLLHSGKRFRPNKKMTVAKRQGQHNESEERETGVILQIEGIMGTEEKIYHLILVEEYLTQIRLCVKPMTSCVSPRTEVRSKALSIIVSEGSKDSSKTSQSSESSTSSQNQLVLSGKNTA